MMEILFEHRCNKISQDVLESHWGVITNKVEIVTLKFDFNLDLAGDLCPIAY
jgi:hypothetical protein